MTGGTPHGARTGSAPAAATGQHGAPTLSAESEFWTLADQIARKYWWPGGDQDDVRQEARIAVVAAVEAFDPSYGTPLRSFVGTVIHRRLKSALISAVALKHQPLNTSTPVEHCAEGVDDVHERVVRRKLREAA